MKKDTQNDRFIAELFKKGYGSNFRKLREESGMTLKDAERELLISYSTISDIERETKDRRPTAQQILTYADYFDVSIDYLLGRSDYVETDAALIGNRLSLTPKAIEKLESMNLTHAAEYYSATDILNTLIETGAIEKICTTISEHLNKIEAADESIDELSAQIESIEADIAKLDGVYEPTEPGESALISEKESDKETLENVLTALEKLKDHSADHTRRYLSHEMYDILKEEVDGIIEDLIP